MIVESDGEDRKDCNSLDKQAQFSRQRGGGGGGGGCGGGGGYCGGGGSGYCGGGVFLNEARGH